MNETNVQGNRNVLGFFLLTFLFSWVLWSPFALSGLGIIQLPESITSLTTLAVMLGAFSPLVSALILIGRKEGRAGIKQFFRNTLSFKIKPVYYVLAVLVPLLGTAAAHYITNLSGLDILPPNLFPEELTIPVIVLVIPYFIMILVAGGGQEEFGWRGYAQEPLQQRLGILPASIIIGLAWGVWHLPLWFMPGDGHAYYSFFAFVLYTISMSVIIGWLYNASGKKLVIPLILHTVSNVSVPFFPTMHMADVPQPGYWVWMSVTALTAILLTIWYTRKSKKLSAQP